MLELVLCSISIVQVRKKKIYIYIDVGSAFFRLFQLVSFTNDVDYLKNKK